MTTTEKKIKRDTLVQKVSKAVCHKATDITFKVFTNRIKGSMIDEDALIFFMTGDSLKMHQGTDQ